MRETYEIRLFTQYLPVIAPDVTISKASPSLATILRGIVDGHAADVQVAHQVPELPIFRRVGAIHLALTDDDHQLRHLVGQAHSPGE